MLWYSILVFRQRRGDRKRKRRYIKQLFVKVELPLPRRLQLIDHSNKVVLECCCSHFGLLLS